jgi:hypothetical protein
MITASLSVTEGSVTRTVSVRAASLARARRVAGEGRPGVRVRLAGPLVPAPEPAAITPPAAIPDRAA